MMIVPRIDGVRTTYNFKDRTENKTLPPEPTPFGMLRFPAGVPEQEADHAKQTACPRLRWDSYSLLLSWDAFWHEPKIYHFW